jgi:hypothetical protein
MILGLLGMFSVKQIQQQRLPQVDEIADMCRIACFISKIRIAK